MSDSGHLNAANAIESAQERRNCKVQVYTIVGGINMATETWEKSGKMREKY